MLVAAAAGLMVLALAIPASAGEWEQDETGWWYQNDGGSYPNNGWTWIDGRCYYFTPEGYCLIDTQTPDGYTVDASGAWTVDGVVQTRNPGGPGYAETVAAGAAVQLDGLSFTMPDGFIQAAAPEEGALAFYHTSQEAVIMAASKDMSGMAVSQDLINLLQGRILDETMLEVFGEPTSKGSLQFASGTWYIFNYADASAVESPIAGTMHVYTRFHDMKLQMIVFLGDFSGIDVNGIMNSNVS